MTWFGFSRRRLFCPSCRLAQRQWVRVGGVRRVWCGFCLNPCLVREFDGHTFAQTVVAAGRANGAGRGLDGAWRKRWR